MCVVFCCGLCDPLVKDVSPMQQFHISSQDLKGQGGSPQANTWFGKTLSSIKEVAGGPTNHWGTRIYNFPRVQGKRNQNAREPEEVFLRANLRQLWQMIVAPRQPPRQLSVALTLVPVILFPSPPASGQPGNLGYLGYPEAQVSRDISDILVSWYPGQARYSTLPSLAELVKFTLHRCHEYLCLILIIYIVHRQLVFSLDP